MPTYYKFPMISGRASGLAIDESPAANLSPFHGMLYDFSTNFSYWVCRTDASVAATMSYFSVYVSTNTRDVNAPASSYHQGATGNLTVTITAGNTGRFTDTTHSDIVSDGDSFNYESNAGAAAGTGDLKFSSMSCLMNVPTSSLAMVTFGGLTLNAGQATVYGAIGGANWWMPTSEAPVKYTLRTQTVYSNLAILVQANSLTASSTFRLRVDGSNGNQVCTVTAGTTGRIEDTSNTDTVSSGSDVNYSWTVGGSGTNISVTMFSMQASTKEHLLISSSSFYDIDNNQALSNGTTYYQSYGSSTMKDHTTSTETDAQHNIYDVSYGKNLFANIYNNSLNGSTTIRNRINAGDGNMSITVTAATTGKFSDTTNTDTFSISDKINIEIDVGGSSGVITPEVIGISLVKSLSVGARSYTYVLD